MGLKVDANVCRFYYLLHQKIKPDEPDPLED